MVASILLHADSQYTCFFIQVFSVFVVRFQLEIQYDAAGYFTRTAFTQSYRTSNYPLLHFTETSGQLDYLKL